jgi:hypothetical protein
MTMMGVLWILMTAILVASFVSTASAFKRKLVLDPALAEDPSAAKLSSRLEGIHTAVEKGLQRLAGECKESAPLLGTALQKYIEPIHQHGSRLLKKTLEEESPHSLLFKDSDTAVYLMTMPITGDRPYQLRQAAGFSQGLAHHVDQVFFSLQSDKNAVNLLIIALFYAPGSTEGTLYAGFQNDETRLLPISLLNSAEIAHPEMKPGNYRQTL